MSNSVDGDMLIDDYPGFFFEGQGLRRFSCTSWRMGVYKAEMWPDVLVYLGT
jgi:hypothetical protein